MTKRNKITNLIIFTAIFIVMMPILANADHDCVEGIDDGYRITATKIFPSNWFLLGGSSISDKAFHSELRKKFKQNYLESFDEGYTGFFCALKDGVYLRISNGDFGSWAEFTILPSKCVKCNKTSADIKYLVSGTGLALGMNKSDVSRSIRYKVESDITTIEFKNILKAQRHRIKHSQKLRLVFREDKLIGFTISEYREEYN